MTCLPRGGRSRPRTRVRRGWRRAVQMAAGPGWHAGKSRLQAAGSRFLALGPRFLAIGSAFLVLGLVPLAPPQAARSETILRVGVLDGSPPCSELRGPGRWEGKAVRLWQFVAARERLAYTLEPYPNAKALLEASRRGAVDLGVGCLTITPERVGTYRFSLPFQESGVALLMGTNRLATLRAVLGGVLDARLLGLLAGYLLAIGVLSLVVWRTEGGYPPGSATQAGSAARSEAGRAALWPTRDGWRQRALVFQVLATGPGTNTIVATTRGQGLVVLSYLMRIVFGPEDAPGDYARRGGGLLSLRPQQFLSAAEDYAAVPSSLLTLENRYGELAREPTAPLPIAVLYGREDRVLDYRPQGEGFAARVPHVRLELVSGGHMLPVTQPARCAEFIRRAAGFE